MKKVLVATIIIFIVISFYFYNFSRKNNFVCDEKFYFHPKMNVLRKNTPDELGWQPAETAWDSVALANLDKIEVNTINKLTEFLTDKANLGITGESIIEKKIRNINANQKEFLIRLWGFKDDSIAGSDYSFVLSNKNEYYRIQSIQKRNFCRRGVSEGNICM